MSGVPESEYEPSRIFLNMAFKIFYGDQRPVGLDPGVLAFFALSINYDDAFAAETAVRLQGEACRQRLPIKIIQFFMGSDFGHKLRHGNIIFSQDSFAQKFVICEPFGLAKLYGRINSRFLEFIPNMRRLFLKNSNMGYIFFITSLKRTYSLKRKPVHLPRRILIGIVRSTIQGCGARSLINSPQLAI